MHMQKWIISQTIESFFPPKIYCKATIFKYFDLPVRFTKWLWIVNPKLQISMGFSWGRKEKKMLVCVIESIWRSRMEEAWFGPRQHGLWVVWGGVWRAQVMAGSAASFISDTQLLLDSHSPLAAISLWCVLSRLVLTMLHASQSLILYANVMCCCMCYPAQEKGAAAANWFALALGMCPWAVEQGLLCIKVCLDHCMQGMASFCLLRIYGQGIRRCRA